MATIGFRPRLSLRTAFAAVTIVAICLASWSIRGRQINAATNAISRLGGRVYLDADCDGAGGPPGPMVFDRNFLGKLAYAWKSRLSPFRTISAVEFGGTSIADEDLSVLKLTPDLVWLSLSNTNVDDKCIPLLAQLHHLRFIDLTESKITRSGAKALRKQKPAVVISDSTLEFEDLNKTLSSLPHEFNDGPELIKNGDAHSVELHFNEK